MYTWSKTGALALACLMAVMSSAPAAEESSITKTEQTYRIGTLQLLDHPSLTLARQGFFDRLDELGVAYEEDFCDGQADEALMQAGANRFVKNDVDLIFSISTSATLTAAAATTDIPILATAVTDYAGADLVVSSEKPGGNISGTSDAVPVAEQIGLITQLVPEAGTIGLLYSESEIFSQTIADTAAGIVADLGLECLKVPVRSESEIGQAVRSVAKKVDAVYVPTDSVIASSLPALTAVTEEFGIPVIAGSGFMVEDGCTAALEVNYYKLGRQTADMAYRVLVEGADIARMPVETAAQLDFFYNMKNADAIGLKIPEALAEEAAEVYGAGTP